MTDGATAIPEVKALLRPPAVGRDVAELGAAFGDRQVEGDDVREFLLRDRRLAAAEILATPEMAVIVAARRR